MTSKLVRRLSQWETLAGIVPQTLVEPAYESTWFDKDDTDGTGQDAVDKRVVVVGSKEALART